MILGSNALIGVLLRKGDGPRIFQEWLMKQAVGGAVFAAGSIRGAVRGPLAAQVRGGYKGGEKHKKTTLLERLLLKKFIGIASMFIQIVIMLIHVAKLKRRF